MNSNIILFVNSLVSEEVQTNGEKLFSIVKTVGGKTLQHNESNFLNNLRELLAFRVKSSDTFLPRARMRSRGRVFGLSVSLFVCLSVCLSTTFWPV